MRLRDVAVVGAGPAGSAVAALAARAGLDVVLVERALLPRHKVCGCCLSSGTLALVRRLEVGIESVLLDGARLTELRLRAGRSAATVPLSGSLALARRSLDQALVRAAVENGATLQEGRRVRALEVGSHDVTLRVRGGGGDTRLRARVVVDATGLGGLRAAGTSAPSVAAGSLVGVGAVFDAEDPTFGPGAIHMSVGRSGYVGLVRFADGRLNVAAAMSPAALRADGSPGSVVNRVLSESGLPPLSDEPAWGWTGTRPLTQRPARVADTRVFRVGDAAGYVEPFTGEGMVWALAGAEALAPLVAAASEEWNDRYADAWVQAHARLTERGQRVCRALAWGLRRHRLTRFVVAAVRRAPSMARPLVRAAERAHSVTAAP